MAGFVAANVLRGDVELAHWTEWPAPGQAAAAAEGPPGDLPPLVLDVRNPAEVAAARIPGSTAIPLVELRGRLDELPAGRELWVHCAAGQRAYYACRILTQHGFHARNLSGGLKTYQMLRDH
jgi:rhodanese-related sulfurtransferase